jgi:hypothetical protein
MHNRENACEECVDVAVVALMAFTWHNLAGYLGVDTDAESSTESPTCPSYLRFYATVLSGNNPH